MKHIVGIIVKEGINYHFISESTGKIDKVIGYVKYINNIDTDVDLGFIDCYPANEFLLEKLCTQSIPCFVELSEEQPKLHEDKLVLII